MRTAYKASILLLLGISVSLSTASTYATSGPTLVLLTPQVAMTLGFHVSIEIEDEVTMVRLVGPMRSSAGCAPHRAGAALLDSSGSELMVHLVEIPQSEEPPETLGSFTNNQTTMAIWLEYMCPTGKVLESRRYIIESIADYVVATQGLKDNH